jgi:crossover junction endodeoxyribonuclease RuvC
MTTWTPTVLGLDLSLTGTGIARIGSRVELLTTVRTTGLTGHERLVVILDAVRSAQYAPEPDLILVEGPSYGSQAGQRGHHERGGLWWLVTQRLFEAQRPYAVVAPRARAKYATGNGNDGKAEVKAAVRERYGHLAAVHNDNEADALVLAMMGADHLGMAVPPVPALNRQAMAKVSWPDLPSDN